MKYQIKVSKYKKILEKYSKKTLLDVLFEYMSERLDIVHKPFIRHVLERVNKTDSSLKMAIDSFHWPTGYTSTDIVLQKKELLNYYFSNE